ncbi:MAG: DUF3168 domain-containing protein [Devosia sp.]|nr:DUF3168 domain-containing protein [Devosia sp.]
MDPTYELQLAALDRLRVMAELVAFVDNRIFDRVPEDDANAIRSPYVSLGPTSAAPADYDCVDGLEITFQIDVWSWGAGEAYGSVEARKIAHVIRTALHKADLPLTVNALVTLRHVLTRVIREPDGIINHAAIQFMAEVEIH